VPGGAVEQEPRLESGKEYVVAPADKVRPVPTLSRRELLAKSATGGSNRAFNRNMANRLWAMMMGRGLVHPVDFDHADNPPTHPELLDQLADEFAALKYDMRAFLREIALTRTYQRSFDAPPTLDSDAARIVTEMSTLESAVGRAEEALAKASAAWQATRREAIAAQEAIDQSLVGLRAAETSLAGARKLAATATATLAASQQQNKAKTDANAAIAVALEQAKQALANLATDADLKLVVEKLQTKSTQLATEIQNHAKTLQSQGEAAQKAIAAVEAAQKSVDDLTAKAAQVEQQGAPALSKCNAARLDLQRAKAALAVQERRRQTAKLVIEYRTKAELLAKARTESGTAPNELEAARHAREEAAFRARLNRRRLSTSERELDALRKQMVVAKSALEARQPAIDNLPAMTDQIDKTAALVKDEELTRAAAVVRNRMGALVAATAAARKQLADQETTSATLVAKCEALNREKPALDQALTAAETRVSEIETQHKETLGNLIAARAQNDSARQNLLEALSEAYAVAPLKPLSAEQLHWSVLQAAGILASYDAAAEAELNKKQAPTEAQKADAGFKKQRAIALEREVHAKLAGNLAPFVQLFACAPGQPQAEFFATADQALFMENSDTIRAWTAPGVTLIHRLIKKPEPAAMAEELYVGVLNRLPTAGETTEVAAWLAQRDGPTPTAVSELAWAILASVEFRFNH
jgi:hypothetical protein